MSQFSTFGIANNVDPITLVGLQNGGNVRAVDAALKAYLMRLGLSPRFIVPCLGGVASTKYDSTNKRRIGTFHFKPALAQWNLSATSTATLCMLLETTNGANAAHGELFQQDGTGGPQLIATTTTTTNLVATPCTADVTAAFLAASPEATFIGHIWLTTYNGIDWATCSNAWIEVQP